MAAVTVTPDVAPNAPAPYHYNDVTSKELPLLEDVMPADLLKLTPDGWRRTQPGERANGIAFKKGRAGQAGFDFGIVGEMANFDGLNPGDPLYPSPSVPGGMDTTPVAGFIPQILCNAVTGIRYNFLV
jgi:hypothetical protein